MASWKLLANEGPHKNHHEMDYMNLGLRSRKTGLDVKQDIEKDEYSMENIDDFFDDDADSTMNSAQLNRYRSRKSSLLPSQLPINQNILPSQIDDQGFKIPSPFINTSRRTSQLHSFNNNNNFSPVNNDFAPIDEVDDDDDDDRYNIPQRKYTPQNNEDLDIDDQKDTSNIQLTPERINRPDYRDVPDLVADDEDDDGVDNTRNDSSFNTSEHAILEDELDDDYELISEEDRDYVEGETSMDYGNGDNGANDSDSDSGNENENNETLGNDDRNNSDSSADIPLRLSRDRNNKNIHLLDDSDEEYIQRQASQLSDEDRDYNADGLRKSSRVKVAPLEYWRNEKIIYKRKSTKPELEIERIVTYEHVDEDLAEAEAKRGENGKKKKIATRARPYNYVPTGKPRGRPRKFPENSQNYNSNPNIQILEEINSGTLPTAQWLKQGILEATVNVTETEKNNEIIAFAPNLAQSEQAKDTKDECFSLEVMFDKHKEHFASGMLKLPLSSKKKPTDSYNTFMTFYVVQGITEVTISDNKFIVTEGSTFQVPAFNEYSFENKGKNEAKMFFVQVTLSEGFNLNQPAATISRNSNESDNESDNEFSMGNKSKEQNDNGK